MRLSPRNSCTFGIQGLEHLILHVRLKLGRFGFVAFGRSDHAGTLLMRAEAGRDLAAQPSLFVERGELSEGSGGRGENGTGHGRLPCDGVGGSACLSQPPAPEIVGGRWR
jgi:hypothetical protein